MKPDCLTAEQWAAALAMSATPLNTLARKMGRGFLRCVNCGVRQPLTANLVKTYLERDCWPHCCEGTAAGGTMSYYPNEDSLRRELAVLAAQGKPGGAS